MSELPSVSGAIAVKAFCRSGYDHVRTGKGHEILKKDGEVTLSVPNHKELKRGLLRSLIRDAGMTIDEFKNHL